MLPVPLRVKPIAVANVDGSRVLLVDELVKNDSTIVQLRIITGHGDSVASHRLAFRTQPIPTRVADSAIEAAAKRVDKPALKAGVRGDVRNQLPRTYPMALGAKLGIDGTMWIARQREPAGQPWLMLDRTGSVVGEVLIPANASLVAASRETVWISESDADGITSAARLRIVQTPPTR